MDLDVLPGELLAEPVEAGLLRQAHGLLALRGLDLLVEEHVHAEGVEVGILDRRLGRQVEPRAQQVRAQVGQALDLREELLFAGEVEKDAANGVAAAVDAQGKHSDEDEPANLAGTMSTS